MQKNIIGNTPMIRIWYKYKQEKHCVYAKLEYYSLTGSIKDRIAKYMLENAKEKGFLKEKQPIVEVSSGNTAISLSAISNIYKHPLHIFMPDWVSIERRNLLTMYGATIHLFSRENGGFLYGLKLATSFAKESDAYMPRQFENNDNVMAHFETTGEEIISSLPEVQAFVSGIGTGGTLMGVGKKLLEYNPNTKIYALEPKTLAIISKGVSCGEHQIEGIGDDFIPKIVDTTIIDEIVLIDDEEAILMAQQLAKELGLGVGISSGANFLASVLLNTNDKIVTVFPDDNKKYLSTKLSQTISKQDSIKIELLSFEVV